MRSLALTGAAAALLVLMSGAGNAQPSSGSGPRAAAGDVPVAPVDRLGPTLPPDAMLGPDSGWNGRNSGGAAGPNYNMVQPLFGPPLPTLPTRRHKPRIILGQ
jgi:hypothetical protein